MAVLDLSAAELSRGLEALVQDADGLGAALEPLLGSQGHPAKVVRGRDDLPLLPIHHSPALVREAELRVPPLANDILEQDDGVQILIFLEVHFPSDSPLTSLRSLTLHPI